VSLKEKMTRTNIPVYVDKNQKQQIEEASKEVGLNQSSFCRTASIEKSNEILAQKKKRKNDTTKLCS